MQMKSQRCIDIDQEKVRLLILRRMYGNPQITVRTFVWGFSSMMTIFGRIAKCIRVMLQVIVPEAWPVR